MSDYYSQWDDVAIAGQSAANGINQLAGAIGDYKSQKEANESRERIAREQNEANAIENEKQRQFELEMWERKAEYESYANKMEMAREAGLNPYAVYGQSIGTPSSGTPHSNPMVGYDFETENAFAKGLKEMAMFNVDQTRQMAAARKDNAEATSVNIANVEYANRLSEQLKNQGLVNDAQRIENEKNVALNPLVVEGQQLSNEHTINLNKVLELEQGLKKFDLDWMKPSEYFKLQEDINLLLQKQISEQELREHWRRMDKNGQLSAAANWLIAETNRMKAPSEIAQNYAQVKYYNAVAGKEEQMRLNLVEITGLNNLAKRMKMTENDIYQQYAQFNAWYENNILKSRSSISEYEVKMAYQSYLMGQKKLNWYDANQIVNTFIPFKYAFGSKQTSQAGEVPLWERSQNPYDPQPIGRPDANGFTPYGNGVFEDSRGWIYDSMHGKWYNPGQ